MSMFKTSAVSRLLGVLVLATILVGSTTGYLLLQSTGEPIGSGESWLTGWGYRKSHAIAGASGAGIGYQIRITAYYSGSGPDSGGNVYLNGHGKSDFGDVRFTSSNGATLLDYWMESYTASTSAVFWVKVADDLNTNPATIYVYYGKSDATTTSNGANTFLLFDDWESYSLGSINGQGGWTLEKYNANGAADVMNDAGDKVLDVKGYYGGTAVLKNFAATNNMQLFVMLHFESLANDGQFHFGFFDSLDVYKNLANNIGLHHEMDVGSTQWLELKDMENAGSSKVNPYIDYANGNYWADTLSWYGTGSNALKGLFKKGTSKNPYDGSFVTKGDLTLTCSETSRPRIGFDDYQYHGAYEHIYVVYFYVKKYVSPEPSHGAWGSEETPNTAPTNGAGSIMNIEILRPNAVGDEENIAGQEPSDGLSHYLKVDDVTPDEATTYLEPASPAGTWQRDLYNVEDLGPAGIINFVKVYGRARTYAASPDRATLKLAIKTGGTAYESAEILLTNSYTTYSNQWTTNPKTGGAWTWSDIDSLQIGENLCRPGGTQSTYFTQVYVEVNAGMDDTNNIYAQKKLYTGSSVATDVEGYADIHYMEFRLKQGATIRASFQYHEDDNTFNIQAGSTTWSLDGSSSAVRSGTQITVTWKFTPQWDAIEESALSIELYVIDAASAADTDMAQSNYVDVVTRLVTGNFATDDSRINIGGTTTISGTVYYANNPASTTSSSSYPPNAEFTSVSIHNSAHSVQATDTTIFNGAFSVSFAIPSAVQSNTYHVYINLADADGPDQDAVDGDTIVVIGDRVKIIAGGIVGNTIDVDEGGKVWYQAVYEYEPGTPFTSGTLKLNGIAMNWTSDRWTYDFPYEMSGSQAVFSITGVLDTQYGLTAFNNVAGNIVLNWATMEITIQKP